MRCSRSSATRALAISHSPVASIRGDAGISRSPVDAISCFFDRPRRVVPRSAATRRRQSAQARGRVFSLPVAVRGDVGDDPAANG